MKRRQFMEALVTGLGAFAVGAQLRFGALEEPELPPRGKVIPGRLCRIEIRDDNGDWLRLGGVSEISFGVRDG